jgi:hypothetical protein
MDDVRGPATVVVVGRIGLVDLKPMLVTFDLCREIGLLADSGTAVSYNPVASLWKGDGVAPALQFRERGIRFGLGTDSTRSDAFRLLDAAEACQRATYGMPMVVELGIGLDVLVGTFIFGIFFFQIRETFDSLDIHHLEKLKDKS